MASNPVAQDEQPAADEPAAPEPDAPDSADTDATDAATAGTEPTDAETAEPDATNADAAEPDAAEADSDAQDADATDPAGADEQVPDEEAAAETRAEAEADAGAERPAGTRGVRHWQRAPLVIGAASVLLAGFAVVAGIEAHGKQSDRNAALTDASATGQVRRQVSAAINTIFSYNYQDTGATRTAAQRLLTGPAVRQYDSLFRLVEQDAPKQHLVLTTKVTDVGVELLIGDRARLLIFADQRDTRQTTQQTSYAGAMFAVNAVRQGGRWKIESIDTFGGASQ